MHANFNARRRLLCGVAGLPLPASSRLWAQAAYPSRQISLIVTLQAGSGSDAASRVVADALGKRLGVPMVIENVPGAGGLVGASKVLNSPPEGYVLGAMNNGLICLVPNMKERPAFEVGALTPVAMLANLPSAMVVPAALPVRNLEEFVAYTKRNAGKCSYGSTGIGSPQHVAMEMLKFSTGADLLHVPYRGGPQSVADVVAGQIQATWNAVSVVAPFVRSGQLRALATGGAERSALLPDVPTLRESGVKDFEYVPWFGFYGPPRMPDSVVRQLNANIQEVLKDPAVIDRLVAVGLEARPMSLAAFEKQGVAERAEMAGVLRRLKLG